MLPTMSPDFRRLIYPGRAMLWHIFFALLKRPYHHKSGGGLSSAKAVIPYVTPYTKTTNTLNGMYVKTGKTLHLD